MIPFSRRNLFDSFSQAFSILPEPRKGPFWNTFEVSTYYRVWFCLPLGMDVPFSAFWVCLLGKDDMQCCFRNQPKCGILKGKEVMLPVLEKIHFVPSSYDDSNICLHWHLTSFWKSRAGIKSYISRCLQYQSESFAYLETLIHNMPDSSYQESWRNILCSLFCNAGILAQHFFQRKVESQRLFTQSIWGKPMELFISWTHGLRLASQN